LELKTRILQQIQLKIIFKFSENLRETNKA
jgi:hypothetical protein